MNIKKVLILGSGALKIGQAGEFDYSGSQAIKAFREEKITTVLVNPNIATVQTSKNFADTVYFLPVTEYFVEKIIKKEKPDGVLLSFGGQTALNCGVSLYKRGVLKKYNVAILGSPIESIIKTEDREKFSAHLSKLNIPIPQSIPATTIQQAEKAADKIGYPVMIRAAYTLGGQSSGVVYTPSQLKRLCAEAFSYSPQILIEKYLYHYKEIEYEVVRDKYDNCITVCNMENVDPMGIHTGESIVVAPSQTLTNYEYQLLRNKSREVVKSLGIVGECNIQFAINPYHKKKNRTLLEYYVIEVNARLSRSSALASKATGYPLAYVAAKLSLGKSLQDIPNKITKKTTSFFEPSLDYCAVKIPRWDIEKFKGANETIGSCMKSVGEVMGIGRTFEEAIQKAVRMLEINVSGITDTSYIPQEALSTSLSSFISSYIKRPTPRRIFAITYALKKGVSIDLIQKITGINQWFLERFNTIVSLEKKLENHKKLPDKDFLLTLKQFGFSDKRISEIIDIPEEKLSTYRRRLKITPSFFQIDTVAGEFPAKTNYLYATYHGIHHDISPLGKNGVIFLGSGPYRIGSSVEFDWTLVQSVQRLSKYNKKSIIINSNPETVSTDYDISSRLYFEELTLERVMDIYKFENPYGIIVSVGGQTPNNLSPFLANKKVPILGTSPFNISKAENRNYFSKILDSLSISQPEWIESTHIKSAVRFSEKVGYPVIVRPSFVLSGNAMSVCMNKDELIYYLEKAAHIHKNYPVTISKFYDGAKEIEFDAVAQKGEIVCYALSEHIEYAGVHSGDATIIYPAQRVYISTYRKIKKYARILSKKFSITGPFNIQFLAFRNNVSVIELNLRASRTFPFISKATNINFSGKIIDAIFNKADKTPEVYPEYTVVKAPQFSFSRFAEADPILDVEMNSTGEVGCFGDNVDEAFLKSFIATGGKLPKKSILVSIGDSYKERFASKLLLLHQMGFKLYATEGTAHFIKKKFSIPSTVLKKAYQHGKSLISHIQKEKLDLVINIRDKWHKAKGIASYKREETDGYRIRRAAIEHNIPLITDIKKARLFVSAISTISMKDLKIRSRKEYK